MTEIENKQPDETHNAKLISNGVCEKIHTIPVWLLLKLSAENNVHSF